MSDDASTPVRDEAVEAKDPARDAAHAVPGVPGGTDGEGGPDGAEGQDDATPAAAAAPEDEAPGHETPEEDAPEEEAPEDGTAEAGAPEDEAPGAPTADTPGPAQPTEPADAAQPAEPADTPGPTEPHDAPPPDAAPHDAEPRRGVPLAKVVPAPAAPPEPWLAPPAAPPQSPAPAAPVPAQAAAVPAHITAQGPAEPQSPAPAAPVATAGLPDTTTTVFAPPRPAPGGPGTSGGPAVSTLPTHSTHPTLDFVPSEPRPVAAGHGPVRPLAPQPAPAPQRLPGVPTPESVPTVDPRLAGAVGRPQRADSLARRTAHSLLRRGRSGDTAALARDVQLPVQTGRVVAVTSIRGGGGKTTVAALLGRTYNHYRQDPVLTLEADSALGTLAVRMGAESVRWSCPDLAQLLNPRMRLMDVTGYLIPVTDGGWLLPASQGLLGAPLDVPTYRRVTLSMRRYFAVTVVDCETLPGEVARTAMDTAHARVVVAPMTAEGVSGTRVVLDWLAGLPQAALASTMVVLTAQSPDMTLDAEAAMAHLRQSGVPVVYLPYDRHLAQGGPIRGELLGTASGDAALRLAAETMQRASRVG
ncbi:hypothetical protein [Streptomyces sp. NPDC050560]|uniref:hypothetical protein n=1 Tax=Streptomyces sp. NPDC050560 TaxID=3365630 RepID=UPI00379384EA